MQNRLQRYEKIKKYANIFAKIVKYFLFCTTEKVKIHFIKRFMPQNLHISKKSSTFARFL